MCKYFIILTLCVLPNLGSQFYIADPHEGIQKRVHPFYSQLDFFIVL